MKLLVVFLLTVLPALCFGLNCHFCLGPTGMAECDAKSHEDECVAGLADQINAFLDLATPTPTQATQQGRVAHLGTGRRGGGRTVGTHWCMKYRLSRSPFFGRGCEIEEPNDNIVEGSCQKRTRQGAKEIICYCNKNDTCNTGDVPKTAKSGESKLTSLTPLLVVVTGFLSLVYL